MESSGPTQALLSILLNCPSIELGRELSSLKDFTREFSPELRGTAINNSEFLRTTHNSLSSTKSILDSRESVELKRRRYVSFVPVEGQLYELDGLRNSPISLGHVGGDDWLQKLENVIDRRVAKYKREGTWYTIMAVTKLLQSSLSNDMDISGQYSSDGVSANSEVELFLSSGLSISIFSCLH